MLYILVSYELMGYWMKTAFFSLLLLALSARVSMGHNNIKKNFVHYSNFKFCRCHTLHTHTGILSMADAMYIGCSAEMFWSCMNGFTSEKECQSHLSAPESSACIWWERVQTKRVNKCCGAICRYIKKHCRLIWPSARHSHRSSPRKWNLSHFGYVTHYSEIYLWSNLWHIRMTVTLSLFSLHSQSRFVCVCLCRYRRSLTPFWLLMSVLNTQLTFFRNIVYGMTVFFSSTWHIQMNM